MVFTHPHPQTSTLPKLWISDTIAGRQLAPFFNGLYSPLTPPTGTLTGHHILSLDPDTPETIWKTIAYNLLNAGCSVSVYPVGHFTNQPLEWYLADIPLDDLVIQLMEAEISWEEWVERLNDEPLTLKQALELAKLAILKILDDEKLNIELDSLRRRAQVSEYSWEKKYLEPLRAKLEKTLALSAPERALNTPAERMKLNISAWLRETDPFKQEAEKARIQSTFRLKDKVFERLCRVLQEAEKRSARQSTLLNLKEGFNLESHALKWLVPGFFPATSSVLLSGLPGCGKTLLAIDLAHAIATGGKFMGEQCPQGKVLLIGSDQPLNMTMSYLADRGFDEENENLLVVGQSGDLPAWGIQDLPLLETWLEETKPKLVIIDSIRTTICYPLGLEEKSEQVGHWLKEVERLVTRYGASLLWIHHDNKDKELKGVSKSSGSTAIPGNVSVHWRVETVSADPADCSRKFSMPKTRGFEGSTLNIRFQPDSGEWENLGVVGESIAAASQRQCMQEQILSFLESRRGIGFEGNELKAVFGESCYSVLSRMVARGLITKRRSTVNKKGKVYLLPELLEELSHTSPDEPPPPTLSNAAVCLINETLSESEFQSPNTHQTLIKHSPNTPPCLPSSLVTEPSQDETSSHQTVDTTQQGEGVLADETVTVLQPETSDVVCSAPELFEQKLNGDFVPAIPVQEEVTQAPLPELKPAAKALKKGQRVKFHFKGSMRDGMIGTVQKVEDVTVFVRLDYHPQLRAELRQLEATLGQLEILE
jgi:DNA polymerase III delta prime subunit